MTLQQNVRSVLGAVSEIAQSEEFEPPALSTPILAQVLPGMMRGEEDGR
jgi:hypothetical protein